MHDKHSKTSDPAVGSTRLLGDFEVIAAMRKYGGDFAYALAEAAMRADAENLRRIKTTWPEYWAKYTEMAKSPNDRGQARREQPKT